MTLQLRIDKADAGHTYMRLYVNYGLVAGMVIVRTSEVIEFITRLRPSEIKLERTRIDDKLWTKLKKFENLQQI